ncbi:MAG: aminomethyl-transferring glycine dehydrogenase subunit GcvPA [Firmicutes bacterium]|nr:aminomethyl-transferring glycine dehydrogenase subunit GcvPA [Bacillota bacterium]
MSVKGFKNHPYIPNSVPEVEDAMLKEIGVASLEDLHAEVPDEIILKDLMNIPPAFGSEYELARHVKGLLKKNSSCEDNLNFLGAGCYQHYVPAICDEINGKGEFLTAYGGESYNDFGRFQALFEFESLVAELVDMEVVNVPTMDYAQAAATAISMGSRISQRPVVLVPAMMDPEKRAVIQNYCEPVLSIQTVEADPATGCLDLADLKAKLNDTVGVVYIENPCYLGMFEMNAKEIAEAAHAAGAQVVCGCDPISLGVVAPPRSFGADIVCGDVQPLGIHMNYGGGQSGFMATMDDPKYVMEFPSRLFGICRTIEDGEYAFADVAYDRTSFGHLRDQAKEYVGTQSALWGITAGVYLATMGPKGMQEVGETILQNAQFAAKILSQIPEVSLKYTTPFFEEFVLDFNKTGKTVEEINKALLAKHIFGGKDLSKEFPALGQCAMYCVTEVHTKEDIYTLRKALAEVLAEVL